MEADEKDFKSNCLEVSLSSGEENELQIRP